METVPVMLAEMMPVLQLGEVQAGLRFSVPAAQYQLISVPKVIKA